jgi:DNA helicase HerA-like ATPase
MSSYTELLAGLVIGTVESVAPDDIRVLLELDSPQATALNTGSPSPFPRINGYVLIPSEAGATVAYIRWIGIERSPYPKRSGMKDFGIIDLPFPLRKMTVSPVGTLTSRRGASLGQLTFTLSRGVSAFPSVGDQVLIPTSEQIKAIVGARDGDKRIRIGTSPMASNLPVMVDPDRLFGRHLAVLGNTGSGKSCTVAGLVRWSMVAASDSIQKEADAKDRTASDRVDRIVATAKRPNARFIVLDPNGEYAKAFDGIPVEVRVFAPGDAQNPLLVPAWMWNSHEWASVASAQPGAQRPLLMQAIRNLRAGRAVREPLHVGIVRQVRLYRSQTLAYIGDPTGASYNDFLPLLKCCHLFKNLAEVMESFHQNAGEEDPCGPHLDALARAASTFHQRHEVFDPGRHRTNYNAPNVAEFNLFLPLFDNVEQNLPAVPVEAEINEDSPIPFDVSQIADYVSALSTEVPSNANMANFVSGLVLRLKSMLASQQLSSVVAPQEPLAFGDWLGGIMGKSGEGEGQVAVIDLSLLPSEILHIIIAVLARLVFEASQRYRLQNEEGKALPTVLVLEEAHNFIKKGVKDESFTTSPAQLCRETFERIAREGRKFGLGLVLSSQRPSELSPTVLAQCNTFLLHRIVNDSDQELVGKLVPDNVAGLLKELPSLPSRQAILLGWATPIPVLVEIDELPEEQRPQSADPDFWEVWTRRRRRQVDWNAIADEWTRGL